MSKRTTAGTKIVVADMTEAEVASALCQPRHTKAPRERKPRTPKLSEPQRRALALLTQGEALTWVFPGPCRIGAAHVDPMVVRALEARGHVTHDDGTWRLTDLGQLAAA